MKIPINMPRVDGEEISAAMAVIKSGNLTSAADDGGKYVQRFEKHVRSFVKSKYAVAVNSGTAALQAALYALDIKYGDEVLIPSFTFVATANAVASVGAKPVFVDVLRENYTMDPCDLERKITPETRAIIPVHLYGNVAYVDELAEISARHQIPIIEDAAQSLGSTYKWKHAGTFFKLGCYSMYPAKVLTSGEGGFVVTDSKRLRDRLLMARNHGKLGGNDSRMLGLNLRLPEISAAIAAVQIKRLPMFLRQRQINARLLSELLSDAKAGLPSERTHVRVNWYLYTVAVKNRDAVMAVLNHRGIGAVPYYPNPIHRMPFYRSGVRLPNTSWAASHVLSLPIHPMVTSKDIRLIAMTFREVNDQNS